MPTRGLRNNNPGNIDKTGEVWEGQELPGSDERFCTFSSFDPYADDVPHETWVIDGARNHQSLGSTCGEQHGCLYQARV